MILCKLERTKIRLPLRYILPQAFICTWSFAVMLYTMTYKDVFQLGYHVPILLEDLYTQVAHLVPKNYAQEHIRAI